MQNIEVFVNFKYCFTEINVHKSVAFMQFFGKRRGLLLIHCFFCCCDKHVCEVGLTGIHSAVAQEMDHGARKKLTEYICLGSYLKVDTNGSDF